jgi:hypothetical protein
MARKKKGKPVSANTGPADRAQRDRLRSLGYTKKTERNSDDESEFNTSDDEKFRTDKLAMTLSEEKIRCDQNTCTSYATCYVITTDPKEDDYEPSTWESCSKHADMTKKFNGLHIAEVITMEEGIRRNKELMPSAEAIDKMERDNNVTLTSTQRLTSMQAKRMFAAEEQAKKAAREARKSESKRKETTKEFDLETQKEEFPTLQAVKKRKVEKEKQEKPNEDKPEPILKYRTLMEEEIAELIKEIDVIPGATDTKEGNTGDTKTEKGNTGDTKTEYGKPGVTKTEKGNTGDTKTEFVIQSDPDTELTSPILPFPESPNMTTQPELMDTQESKSPEEKKEATKEKMEKEIAEDISKWIARHRKETKEETPLDDSEPPTFDELDLIKLELKDMFLHEEDRSVYHKQLEKLRIERENWNAQERAKKAEQTHKKAEPPVKNILYSKLFAQKDQAKETSTDEDEDFVSESDEDQESELKARECALLKPHSGSQRTPPYSDQSNTLWWDISKVTADHKTIANAIARENQICGFSYRDSSEWLELAYNENKYRDEAMKRVVIIDKRNTISPIAPRHMLGNEVFVQLVNVPIRPETQVRNELIPVLEVFGKIKSLEPIKFKFKNLATRRWNLILCIPWGTRLVMPPIIEVKGHRVLACFEGGLSACSTCLQEGHWSNKCTTKFRKQALEKAYLKAPPAPLNVTTPPTVESTPPEASTSQPHPPPPQPEAPKIKVPKPTPPPVQKPTQTDSGLGLGKGKGREAMKTLLEQQTPEIKEAAKARGFGVPTLKTPPAEDIEKETTEGDFTTVTSEAREKREKQRQEKQRKAKEDSDRNIREIQQALKAKAEEEKRQKVKAAKAKKPAAKISPLGHIRTSKPKAESSMSRPGRKRTTVEKGQYCWWAIKHGGKSSKHVERIWNKNRDQWEEYRETIDPEIYRRVYDWARSPKGKTVVFNPTEFGIETNPTLIQEPELSSSSSSDQEDKNKILVKVRIVDPKKPTKDTGKYNIIFDKFNVPIGKSEKNLKKQIAEKYEVDATEFRIVSRGKEIHDMTFGKGEKDQIKNNFLLNVLGNWEIPTEVPEPTSITIIVQNPQGMQSAYQVGKETTVHDVMREYGARHQVLPRQLVFLFDSTTLDPQTKVLEYGIKDKDVIFVSREKKLAVRVRAEINGTIVTKGVRTTDETTFDILKHDVTEAYGTLAADFELEKDGVVLPSTGKIGTNIQDADVISIRYKGTTQWDVNVKTIATATTSEMIDTDTQIESDKKHVTLRYDTGTEWVKVSFNFDWSEETTIGQIREYLRNKIADDKLQIRIENQTYEIDTKLKDTDLTEEDLERMELYVLADQEDEYLEEAEPGPPEDTGLNIYPSYDL